MTTFTTPNRYDAFAETVYHYEGPITVYLTDGSVLVDFVNRSTLNPMRRRNEVDLDGNIVDYEYEVSLRDHPLIVPLSSIELGGQVAVVVP
jgi:hypothetical protein